MSRINYTCARCGNPILSPNRIKKYCSEECALEAHRAQCRERAKRHYWADIEQTRTRRRKSYTASIRKELTA